MPKTVPEEDVHDQPWVIWDDVRCGRLELAGGACGLSRHLRPHHTRSSRHHGAGTELPENWDNVSVVAWAGLTVAFCRQHGAGVIIRGARNRSDLRHEYQLAAMNEALGITTLLPAQPGLAAMSSTLLRGLGS